MKITIVYQYYQNHAEPGHSLIYELAHYLGDRGHGVAVVTGEFGYMKQQAPSAPWYRRILQREQDGKVRVIRTYTYSQYHRSYMGRLLGFLSFSVLCPFGMFLAGKADVVLASSPPIFPMLPAWFVSALRRTPFVLEVRDIWPEAAVQMGVVHNRFLIGVMSLIEKLLYDRSRKIVTLTEGIRKDICRRGWPAEKVVAITCGIDANFLHPDADGGRCIRERYGWQDKKVILYFGALGEANNIPVILRAAQRLKERSDILFVLVGDGMMRVPLEKKKAEEKIDNLVILPPVPKSEARLYINAADLCLVTMRNLPLFGMSSIPTKLVDYMACGRPVLYGARGETEQILQNSGAGLMFNPDDDQELAERILALTENSEMAERMGANGPPYVALHFTLSAAQQRMEKVLEEARTLVKCA